jgi:hypothetical protein
MGHGRGAGLLYHAEYPERFWQRLSKGRPSDDWQRHQMSSLTFIGEEPFLFSGLYHVCVMFASCVSRARMAEASHSYASHISVYRGNQAGGRGNCCGVVVESMERHIEAWFE